VISWRLPSICNLSIIVYILQWMLKLIVIVWIALWCWEKRLVKRFYDVIIYAMWNIFPELVNARDSVDVKFQRSLKVHTCLFARFQSVSKCLFIACFNWQVIGHEIVLNLRTAQLIEAGGQLPGLGILLRKDLSSKRPITSYPLLWST